jgi:hypothetical protein
MSQPHSQPFHLSLNPSSNHSNEQLIGSFPPFSQAVDCAIDTALRTVPLPDGLLTRLSRLIYAMPDDAPDQVDWLGC